jgi:HTH-type transcriptional regulator / antitoxin HipB
MIKNEKQYKVSKKRLADIEQILKEKNAKAGTREAGALASLVMMKNDIAEQIKKYDALKKNGITLRKKITVSCLPGILIEHKIARGFTQKQYSEILGIKEQQLQRYEAENYQSVSFGRLMEYLNKAKINVSVVVE